MLSVTGNNKSDAFFFNTNNQEFIKKMIKNVDDNTISKHDADKIIKFNQKLNRQDFNGDESSQYLTCRHQMEIMSSLFEDPNAKYAWLFFEKNHSCNDNDKQWDNKYHAHNQDNHHYKSWLYRYSRVLT